LLKRGEGKEPVFWEKSPGGKRSADMSRKALATPLGEGRKNMWGSKMEGRKPAKNKKGRRAVEKMIEQHLRVLPSRGYRPNWGEGFEAGTIKNLNQQLRNQGFPRLSFSLRGEGENEKDRDRSAGSEGRCTRPRGGGLDASPRQNILKWKKGGEGNKVTEV